MNVTWNVLKLYLLAMSIALALGGSCMFIGPKLVKVYGSGKTWNAARQFCQATQVCGVTGDLAADKYQKTHKFLTSTLRNINPEGKALWIGGHETGGSWKWVTGGSISKSHKWWSAGQPDNAHGGQYCLAVNYYANKWDDQDCGKDINAFACEFQGFSFIADGKYRYIPANNGIYLKYHSTKKTFDQAKAACASEGGLLVVANTKTINNWLADQAGGSTQWIGATDLAKEGSWVWSDGSAVSTTDPNWAAGKPDNIGRYEHCGSIAKGKWDDILCIEKHPFTCQISCC